MLPTNLCGKSPQHDDAFGEPHKLSHNLIMVFSTDLFQRGGSLFEIC
jgi:hypothetical protein